MKKIILIFLIVFLVCGCGSNKEDSESTKKEKKNVVWTVEPNLDFDYIVPITTQEISPRDVFYKDDRQSYFHYIERDGLLNIGDYDPNIMFVIKDNRFGVYDFNGNEIQSINENNLLFDEFSPYFIYYSEFEDEYSFRIVTYKDENLFPSILNQDKSANYNKFGFGDNMPKIIDGKTTYSTIMSYDCKEYVDLFNEAATCLGTGPGEEVYNVILDDNIVYKPFVFIDDNHELYIINYEDVNDKYGYIKDDMERNITENWESNKIIPILYKEAYYDEEFNQYFPRVSGLACVSKETGEIKQLENTYAGDFINGYFVVTNEPANDGGGLGATTFDYITGYEGMYPYEYFQKADDYAIYSPQINDDAKYGLVRAKDNKLIADIVYDDLMYFSEGIAGVCKDEKWAFIDEEGNFLSDFIFDDISAVYDGKSYVQINRYYGILNIKETLNDNTYISEKTLGIDFNNTKEKFKMPVCKIDCLVNSIKIRNEPSLNGDVVGFIGYMEENRSAYVFEIFEDEDYNWYRIGDNQWIASSKEEKWYYEQINKKLNIDFFK